MAIRELKVCLLGVSPGSSLRGSPLLRAFVPALPGSGALLPAPGTGRRVPSCSRASPIAPSAPARLGTLGLARLRGRQGEGGGCRGPDDRGVLQLLGPLGLSLPPPKEHSLPEECLSYSGEALVFLCLLRAGVGGWLAGGNCFIHSENEPTNQSFLPRVGEPGGLD